MADHIGVSGNAMHRGIPTQTVGWTGTVARTLTIFNTIDKSSESDVKTSKDNNGNTIEMNRTDKRFKIKFSAKPIGANVAAAEAIGEDLPQKMDILTITSNDPQVDTAAHPTNTAICDSASAKWSPEGELVVDIEATVWGAAFTAFS